MVEYTFRVTLFLQFAICFNKIRYCFDNFCWYNIVSI